MIFYDFHTSVGYDGVVETNVRKLLLEAWTDFEVDRKISPKISDDKERKYRDYIRVSLSTKKISVI